MNTVPDLLAHVLKSFAALGKLRHRKMFGGVYIYCDDLFIATIHDATLYFKANANTAPDFIERGLPVFTYPKQGGVATLQYYQAPREVFTDEKAMQLWASKALLAAKQDAATKRPSRKSVVSSRERRGKEDRE